MQTAWQRPFWNLESGKLSIKVILGGIVWMAFTHAHLRRAFPVYKGLAGIVEFLVASVITANKLADIPKSVETPDVTVKWAGYLRLYLCDEQSGKGHLCVP